MKTKTIEDNDSAATVRDGEIVHLTTVHPRTDPRIFIREIPSLAEFWNVKVIALVADGLPNAVKHFERGGIEYRNIGKSADSRLMRMTRLQWQAFRQIVQIRPKVLHFHDPELLFVGIAARLLRVKVIYDVHEDVPKQILSKTWIKPWLRTAVASAVKVAESISAKFLNGFVAATPSIGSNFPQSKTVVVRNYPNLKDLSVGSETEGPRIRSGMVYVGGISRERGVIAMIDLVNELQAHLPNIRLTLAGTWENQQLRTECAVMPGWQHVDDVGFLTRDEVVHALTSASLGLLLLEPAPNHLEALPTKMFEYMACGLPVLASDFPLWREILDATGAGVTVNMADPVEVLSQALKLLTSTERARALGADGRQAVVSEFNWSTQEDELFRVYELVLKEAEMKNRKWSN